MRGRLFNDTEGSSLSTIDEFSESDFHKNSRVNGNKYFVETESINDLLH